MKTYFFTYISRIFNNPLVNGDIPGLINSLVRTESETGKTIWAKEILYYSESNYFSIVKTKIVDDVAWVLLVYYLTELNAPGIIAKIDKDGNLIESFYSPFYVDVASNQNYMFIVIDFILLSDLSFITTANWLHYTDNFGISAYSLKDFSYFKIDSDRNFKWSTSIDFTYDNEESQSMYEYNSSLYVAIISSKFYYWLQSLNIETGAFQNSQCAYVSKRDSNSYKTLKISYVSDKFVYAYGEGMSNSEAVFPISLYMFNQTTYKLSKVFYSAICNRYYGFRNLELNSDTIYCENYAKINRIYFNESEAFGEIHYKFNGEFISENLSSVIMKEISYGQYIMSISQLVFYNYSGYMDVFTFKIDSNYSTNPCLSLEIEPAIDSFTSISIGSNSSTVEFIKFYIHKIIIFIFSGYNKNIIYL